MPRVAKVYTLSLRQPPLLEPEAHAQMLRTDVRVHERTRELATMYNSRRPPKKVAVLPAAIVTVERTSSRSIAASSSASSGGGDPCMYFVEPFMPGEYVKHTSNYGFVGRMVEAESPTETELSEPDGVNRFEAAEIRQTPQCFSCLLHATFVYTTLALSLCLSLSVCARACVCV